MLYVCKIYLNNIKIYLEIEHAPNMFHVLSVYWTFYHII